MTARKRRWTRRSIYISPLGTRTRAADTLYELAALDRDRGRLQEANAKSRRALDRLDAIGAGAGSAESRMRFAASHRKSYDFAIDMAMRLHQSSKRLS